MRQEWVLLKELILFLLLEFKQTVVFLRSQKGQFSDRKEIRRTMESKLEGTVNYLELVDCTPDAEKTEKLQDRPPQ